MKTIGFFLSATLLLAACGNGNQSSDADNKNQPSSGRVVNLTNNPENPNLLNLTLEDKMEADSSVSYRAKAVFENDTIGFIVEVNKHIPAGINKEGAPIESGFVTGVIRFKKSGPESDRFVKVLGELWQVPGLEKMSAEPVVPLAFSSNKRDVDVDKSATYSFKLFFDPDSPTPGEVFFTFDTYKRSITFQEKDPQYRTTIIGAFSGS